MDTQSLFN